jgi:hypothetical protein
MTDQEVLKTLVEEMESRLTRLNARKYGFTSDHEVGAHDGRVTELENLLEFVRERRR